MGEKERLWWSGGSIMHATILQVPAMICRGEECFQKVARRLRQFFEDPTGPYRSLHGEGDGWECGCVKWMGGLVSGQGWRVGGWVGGWVSW